MKILATFLTFFILFPIFSQDPHLGCGTDLDEKTHRYISELLSKGNERGVRRASDGLQGVAFTAHIVRRTDGTGGLSESQLSNAFELVNEHYGNAGLEFLLFGKIDYIDNDDFFDFDSNKEDNIANPRDVSNTINIYFVNSLTSEGTALCGYAYFPGNPDRIFMANSCTTNGTTLSHEIGHYLTLYHTHGRTNTGTTDELVDGSNCTSAGDELCDTPADPNLTGNVENCRYVGNLRDTNGDSFQPDVENIMSYAPQACRRTFTTGQYDRAFTGYSVSRNYLYENKFVADFKPQSNIVCVSDAVEFTNLSLGEYEGVLWEFEGGTPSSSEDITPTVTFEQAGIYQATLTIFGEDGSSDIKVIEKAISVVEYNSVTASSYHEGFEGSPNHITHSPGDNFSFEVAEIGYESDQSISMNFFEYEETGTEDFLLLEPLEHPGSNDYVLSFDYAFTYGVKNNVEQIDQVTILYNTCGSWNEIIALDGKTDATSDPKTIRFFPETEDWKSMKVYVPAPEGAPYIQVMVRATNSNGNNFYMDNIEIEYTDEIVVRSISVKKEDCTGDGSGKIEVNASFNGAEVVYSLDNELYSSIGVFDNINSGQYTVYLQGGGMSREETLEVGSVIQSPAKPFIIFSNEILRLLTTDAEIEWYYDNELVEDSGVNWVDFQGNGTYYVIVRNASGCESISDPFVILATDQDLAKTELYPNPFQSVLNIRFSGNTGNAMDLTLLDLTGNELTKEEDFDGGTIDTSSLSKGVYLVQLKSETEVRTFKVIKK